MKSELWWASIGGNKCEPIRIIRKNKNDFEWYSIGCSDAHPCIDGILLIEQILNDDILHTPKEAKAAERKYNKQLKEMAKFSYRRFD